MIYYNYVNIMCEFHAQRANKRKCENKFGNNPMKMCCKHKIRMKIGHRIKDIIKNLIVFLLRKLWFLMEFFCHVFLMFKHANVFFFFHCDLHSLKVLHKNWCSYDYVCIMWKKKMIEKISGPKKKVLLSLMFFFLG